MDSSKQAHIYRSEKPPAAAQQTALPSRCAVIVGTGSAGKTQLANALIDVARQIDPAQQIDGGPLQPDSALMSEDLHIRQLNMMDEEWTLIDTPGSAELMPRAQQAMMVADGVIVLCDADLEQVSALQPLLSFLEERAIPHLLFINKIDRLTGQVQDKIEQILKRLAQVSNRQIVLRELPLKAHSTNKVCGYLDLATEQAFVYREGRVSELVNIPHGKGDQGHVARQKFVEELAKEDEQMLIQLMEGRLPSEADIYASLNWNISQDKIMQVLFGSALTEAGIRRLLKSLRHDFPTQSQMANRASANLDLPNLPDKLCQTFHIRHDARHGRLTQIRLTRGHLKRGDMICGQRVTGIYIENEGYLAPVSHAFAGDIVTLTGLTKPHSGDLLSENTNFGRPLSWPGRAEGMISITLHLKDASEQERLDQALRMMTEEDPGLSIELTGASMNSHAPILWCQGEYHADLVVRTLRQRFGLSLRAIPPQIKYAETIDAKKIGHAQTKDEYGLQSITLEISPLPRGSGVSFINNINLIDLPPTLLREIDNAARTACDQGALGFGMTDISISLIDATFAENWHEMDHYTALTQQAIQDALSHSTPTLLEPIMLLTISTPQQYQADLKRLIERKRGKLLRSDSHEGWNNWVNLMAQIPRAELDQFCTDFRMLTQSLGRYTAQHGSMMPLIGKEAINKIRQQEYKKNLL